MQRLAAEYPQHTIFCLDPVVCPCSTMYRIHPGYLAWVLEGLVARRGAQPHHRADDVAGTPASRSSACSRPSPEARMTWRRGPWPARLVVVGSGIAGLYAALLAAERTAPDVEWSC